VLVGENRGVSWNLVEMGGSWWNQLEVDGNWLKWVKIFEVRGK
jgi:hypothetical protein